MSRLTSPGVFSKHVRISLITHSLPRRAAIIVPARNTCIRLSCNRSRGFWPNDHFSIRQSENSNTVCSNIVETCTRVKQSCETVVLIICVRVTEHLCLCVRECFYADVWVHKIDRTRDRGREIGR